MNTYSLNWLLSALELGYTPKGPGNLPSQLVHVIGELIPEEQALVSMYLDTKFYNSVESVEENGIKDTKAHFAKLKRELHLTEHWNSTVPYEKHFYESLIVFLDCIVHTAQRMKSAAKTGRSVNWLGFPKFPNNLIFCVIPFLAVEYIINEYTRTFVEKYRAYLESTAKGILYENTNELTEHDDFTQRLLALATESFYVVVNKEDNSNYAHAVNAFVEPQENTETPESPESPKSLDFTDHNTLVALQNCFYDYEISSRILDKERYDGFFWENANGDIIPGMTVLINDYYRISISRTDILDVDCMAGNFSKIYSFECDGISYGVLIEDKYDDSMVRIPFTTIEELVGKLYDRLQEQ